MGQLEALEAIKTWKVELLADGCNDDPKKNSWVIVGHKALEGKAWMKASMYRRSLGRNFRATNQSH